VGIQCIVISNAGLEPQNHGSQEDRTDLRDFSKLCGSSGLP